LPPPKKPKRPAWNRPPINIEYSLTNANFPALPTNKTDETKFTASSTKFTVSEDYKSIIEKEMALYKTEAAQARSDLLNLETEITDMVNQTIQQSLKGIFLKVHNQSTATFLTATEYCEDMTDFHDQFKKQTELICALSEQIQEMKNPTPRRQRPTKKAHLALDDLLPQSLNSSFESQSPC
jgi:hypothetical protein